MLNIILAHLAAVDAEVGGAVDGDEEMGDSHHDVHLGTPYLCVLTTCSQ